MRPALSNYWHVIVSAKPSANCPVSCVNTDVYCQVALRKLTDHVCTVGQAIICDSADKGVCLQHVSEFFVTSANAALSKSDEPEKVKPNSMQRLYCFQSNFASTNSAEQTFHAVKSFDQPAFCDSIFHYAGQEAAAHAVCIHTAGSRSSRFNRLLTIAVWSKSLMAPACLGYNLKLILLVHQLLSQLKQPTESPLLNESFHCE